jgi:hypothetical protein
MTRPPLPVTITPSCSLRPEQNLTHIGVSGAVLLRVHSEAENAIWHACRTNLNHHEVKNIRNSVCILDCSKSFTLVRRIYLKVKPVANSTSESTGGKNTKTGGSDPTFSASGRPKIFWGRSRPFWFNPGCVSRSDELEVNASQQVLFTLAFTLTFTSPSGVPRSVKTISIESACDSCTSLNHGVGLERPHFRCHRSRGGRSSPLMLAQSLVMRPRSRTNRLRMRQLVKRACNKGEGSCPF